LTAWEDASCWVEEVFIFGMNTVEYYLLSTSGPVV